MANAKKKSQGESKAKVKVELVDCELCNGSGLKDFNVKGLSELSEMCSECAGSGKVKSK